MEEKMKLGRVFGRHYCPVCGTRMAVFRHPTRYACRKPWLHAAIESDQDRGRGRRGAPGNAGNLGKYSRAGGGRRIRKRR